MDSRSMTVRPLLVALLVLAFAAPAANAADPAGFAGMLPRASALCVKADAGKLGKRLRPDAGKVKKACATLRSAYSAALTEYQAAVRPIADQIRTLIQQTRETCAAARRNRDIATCREAQRTARLRTRELRAQMQPYAATFNKKVDAARKTFWAAIRKLKGGKGLGSDAQPGTAPSTDVPDDSGIDSA